MHMHVGEIIKYYSVKYVSAAAGIFVIMPHS